MNRFKKATNGSGLEIFVSGKVLAMGINSGKG